MPFLRTFKEGARAQFVFLFLFSLLAGALHGEEPELVTRSSAQWTGVAVASGNRLFVSFPAWGKGYRFPLGEVVRGEVRLFEPRMRASQSKLVIRNAQSLKGGAGDLLWILDNANPDFRGIRPPGPRLLAVDVESGRLVVQYLFSEETFRKNSYFNDFCLEASGERAYVSDSGAGGIVMMDLKTGISRRFLDKAPQVMAETPRLVIQGAPFRITSHVNGIALDPREEHLYFSALSGHTLYRLPLWVFRLSFTPDLIARALVEPQGAIPASDGMAFDHEGDLYLTGIETGEILRVRPHQEAEPLVPGFSVSWPDSLAVAGRTLILTASDITGDQGSYELYRIPLQVRSHSSAATEWIHLPDLSR